MMSPSTHPIVSNCTLVTRFWVSGQEPRVRFSESPSPWISLILGQGGVAGEFVSPEEVTVEGLPVEDRARFPNEAVRGRVVRGEGELHDGVLPVLANQGIAAGDGGGRYRQG